MEITWQCKSFNELSNKELYSILALRTAIFIVEQNCPFQDQDGKKDYESHHLFAKTTDNEIVAYSRILPENLAYPMISIGRVVTASSMRGAGIGKLLMEKSIEMIYEKNGEKPIKIGAQYYLKKFYESFGFEKTSEIYLEDGIEHIEMVKIP
jgi:ElaA protein